MEMKGLIAPQSWIGNPDLNGIFHHCQWLRYADLSDDIRPVLLYGLGTDTEQGGNLFGGIPLDHQAEDLLFSLCKVIIG